ncbi:MAG: MarC family protein [Gammaproteobacteria bacterium]|nr:MarC family protein [Gammaproteobacteria bacterium]NNF62179.1 NAAT family transporter [Gammaproteobacteria bacterium]NNM20138.1 NAAT family transporter [Gammaproteobacteria bacterium]
MIEQLIKQFVVLFVVIEPISLVPMFGALTRGGSVRYRRKMALKASALSALILVAFALAGDYLLDALGISVEAFKIGGGLLLFLIAVDMVFARDSGLRSTTVREQEEARYREDISVFPLAFPLIAGPGALATVLLMVGDARNDFTAYIGIMAMLLLVILIVLVLLLTTPWVMRVIGRSGADVISRLLGVVLAALAVQYVTDGIRGTFSL